jgi:F0F1-type ATP synthase delta subunit
MTADKEISIWAKVLLAAVEKGGAKEARESADKLAVLLQKKKKKYLFAKILEKAQALYTKKNGATLFLAHSHSEEFTAGLKKKVALTLQKEAENIQICLDPAILGGFRAKSGSLLVRASIKDFLSELKRKITG